MLLWDEARPRHEIRVVVECDAYSNVDIYGLEQGGMVLIINLIIQLPTNLIRAFYDITAFYAKILRP